ncbi:hypothetical protein DLJ53_21945 [Acuticoccus sediminis]|uniref:Uncharacterized protein n=1 Tax=Acuticoccus sediminis TaxID=2184697 RepID=A0A8B2NKX9_9HYPH|nr:hypothetical protein [Acuticoccus sediminis]RAH99210.1 hypothetical protein DLJ53_21945 [Acuticoccus sediminis]
MNAAATEREMMDEADRAWLLAEPLVRDASKALARHLNVPHVQAMTLLAEVVLGCMQALDSEAAQRLIDAIARQVLAAGSDPPAFRRALADKEAALEELHHLFVLSMLPAEGAGN